MTVLDEMQLTERNYFKARFVVDIFALFCIAFLVCTARNEKIMPKTS